MLYRTFTVAFNPSFTDKSLKTHGPPCRNKVILGFDNVSPLFAQILKKGKIENRFYYFYDHGHVAISAPTDKFRSQMKSCEIRILGINNSWW